MKKALGLLFFITTFAATTSLHPQLESILGHTSSETSTSTTKPIIIRIFNLTDRIFDLDLCYTHKNSATNTTKSEYCTLESDKQIIPKSMSLIKKLVTPDLNYRLGIYKFYKSEPHLNKKGSWNSRPFLEHNFVPADFSTQATLPSGENYVDFLIFEPIKGVVALIKASSASIIDFLPTPLTVERIG